MGPGSPDFVELVWENGQLLARGRSIQSSDSQKIQNQCQEGIFKDKKSSSLQEALSVLYKDFEHNVGSSHAPNSLERVPDQAPVGDGDVHPLTSLKHRQVSVPNTKANPTLIPSSGSANQGENRERTNFSALFKPLSSGTSRPTSGLSAAEGFKGEDNKHVTGRGSWKLGSKEAASALEERQVRFPASHLDSTDNDLGPSPRNNPPKELLPDEQSESSGHKAACKIKGCSDFLLDPSSSLVQCTSQRTTTLGNDVEQLAASSCGASNDLTYNFKRIREESDSYTSEEDIPEEEHNCLKEVPDQLSKGRKRSRVQEVHNLSEKRRRAKINKKMRALQELIPKCSKVDKASLLDDAIDYLKALQHQVQMMAMGTTMFHPGMMLPTPAQHLNTQHLGNYSALASFMPGMRMPMLGGCSPLQVPHSLLSGASSSAGFPEAQPDIACFPSQALPISGTHSPFLVLPQMASPQYVQAAQNAPVSAGGQIQLPNSAPLPSGKKPKQRDIIGKDK